MKTQNFILVLVLLFVIAFVVARADQVQRALGGIVSPEPTTVPSVCANFEFEHLLPPGAKLRKVEPVDTNGDSVEECVVLYDAVTESYSMFGHPVYGLVYHFEAGDGVRTDPSSLPVSNMQRYELKTDYGKTVQLGLTADGSSGFDMLSADYDTKDGLELVVLDRLSTDRIKGLSVFRWEGEDQGYKLVGYAHGDWLEVVVGSVERYVDEVRVCDRRFPADANNPNQVQGQIFQWRGDKLEADPERGLVRCSN